MRRGTRLLHFWKHFIFSLSECLILEMIVHLGDQSLSSNEALIPVATSQQSDGRRLVSPLPSTPFAKGWLLNKQGAGRNGRQGYPHCELTGCETDSSGSNLNMDWREILFKATSRRPLWSSGHSSWLQRSEFDSRLYQIFWEIVGLERGPFSLVSSIEEILERKSSGSGLETEITSVGIRHDDHTTPSICKRWH
jgi:hypothetical protein